MLAHTSAFTLFILSIIGVVYSAIFDTWILNGTDANINDYPFMASIIYHDKPLCGGTILNANAILTAATCIHELSINYYSVRVGSSIYTSGQQIRAAKFISHEQYNHKTQENDIGLIKLEKNIEFGESVAIVKLPKPNTDVSADVIGVIVGWGLLCMNSSDSTQLQRAEVPVVDRSECKNFYEPYERIVSQEEICGGKRGVDGCLGDSGGPLIVNGEIVGIVSWGGPDATAPTVYTRVSYFIDWINQHI